MKHKAIDAAIDAALGNTTKLNAALVGAARGNIEGDAMSAAYDIKAALDAAKAALEAAQAVYDLAWTTPEG
jgi:surface antigen